MTPQLTSFLRTGIKPTSDRERSALLDESRSFIESLATEVKNWTPPTTGSEVEAVKKSADAAKAIREKAAAELDKQLAAQRAKSKASAAAINPPRASAKPAAPAAPAPTATAASFATPPLTMLRAEFDKLTPADKTRFFKSAGKLI